MAGCKCDGLDHGLAKFDSGSLTATMGALAPLVKGELGREFMMF